MIVIFYLWERQNGPYSFMFTYFGQVSYFTDFGQVKMDPSHSFLLISDRSVTLLLWASCYAAKNDLAQVIFNWSINQNQGLCSLVNKYTSKNQFCISFCSRFFGFVQQSKICMIRIKTQKVYIKGEISFIWLFFDNIAKSHI